MDPSASAGLISGVSASYLYKGFLEAGHENALSKPENLKAW